MRDKNREVVGLTSWDTEKLRKAVSWLSNDLDSKANFKDVASQFSQRANKFFSNVEFGKVLARDAFLIFLISLYGVGCETSNPDIQNSTSVALANAENVAKKKASELVNKESEPKNYTEGEIRELVRGAKVEYSFVRGLRSPGDLYIKIARGDSNGVRVNILENPTVLKLFEQSDVLEISHTHIPDQELKDAGLKREKYTPKQLEQGLISSPSQQDLANLILRQIQVSKKYDGLKMVQGKVFAYGGLWTYELEPEVRVVVEKFNLLASNPNDQEALKVILGYFNHPFERARIKMCIKRIQASTDPAYRMVTAQMEPYILFLDRLAHTSYWDYGQELTRSTRYNFSLQDQIRRIKIIRQTARELGFKLEFTPYAKA